MSENVKPRIHLPTLPPKWSRDFPIRWDEDHYVTRRELAKFLTLGSAILVGANATIALVGRSRTTQAYAEQRLCAVDELSPGQSLLFRYPTDADPCILVRTQSGAWAAFSQVCTHLSCAVVYRPSDDRLFCPCHQGVFACQEGTAGAEPLEGPPERPLPRILLTIRDGHIHATGVAT
ncbi:ubiquinol-cytochrome c reductase iron-sulfur subunit [Pendulispora albinea]|uniref:Rieske 2Fe-2S domain-containing protein n=1 Tax=Pendulispora albinea TaxID=2741071 RepID=A0ABZ2M7J7_9BACT